MGLACGFASLGFGAWLRASLLVFVSDVSVFKASQQACHIQVKAQAEAIGKRKNIQDKQKAKAEANKVSKGFKTYQTIVFIQPTDTGEPQKRTLLEHCTLILYVFEEPSVSGGRWCIPPSQAA